MVSKDKNIVNFTETKKKRAADARRARKQQAREDKEARAEANRQKYGRTKAEKARDKQQKQKNKAHLDGHQRDSTPDTARNAQEADPTPQKTEPTERVPDKHNTVISFPQKNTD